MKLAEQAVRMSKESSGRRPFTLFLLALAGCWVFLTAAATTDATFEIASVYRAEAFDQVTGTLKPSSPDDVLVVTRLTGIDLELFRDEAKQGGAVLILPDGSEVKAGLTGSAESVRVTDSNGEVKTFAPYMILVFSAPRDVDGEVSIVVGSLPAVSIDLPNEILQEVGNADLE